MTVFIALAGGLGAASRLVLEGMLRAEVKHDYPWATSLINISGSFLLGLVTSLTMDSHWHAILGAGFLGGYTTFSTASFETARLAHAGRYRTALANGLGMLIIAVGAASFGVWLGTL